MNKWKVVQLLLSLTLLLVGVASVTILQVWQLRLGMAVFWMSGAYWTGKFDAKYWAQSWRDEPAIEGEEMNKKELEELHKVSEPITDQDELKPVTPVFPEPDLVWNEERQRWEPISTDQPEKSS